VRLGSPEVTWAFSATAATEAAQPGRLPRLAEVRHRAGPGKTMIYTMIGDRCFPKPYKITAAAARWSEREVEAWIAGVVRDSRAD
jgi:prophage regulatory protein